MKIGYFGDGPWAHQALDQIVDKPGLRVVCIVARHKNPDPVLRERANELEVPFHAPEDVNAEAFLDQLKKYSPDINVSMSYNQILRKQAIDLAPEGFINCHAGALPFYRGRNILNWALINGENRFGVTVHYVDTKIDTGAIIAQRFEVITPSDTYKTLLEKAPQLCAEALIEALSKIRNGSVAPVDQDSIHPVGFYCSRRREGDEWIDWSWPTKRIHNFVRALTPPGPGARTKVKGSSIVVTASEKIQQAPAYIDRPGTVVGRNEEGIIVKTGDTTIHVSEIADWNGGISNRRTPSFPISTMLTSKPDIDQLQKRVAHLEERIAKLEKEQS